MPYFSIYAPVSGPLHYYTVTLIGFQRGLLVRWSHGRSGWSPCVVHIRNVPEFNGSRLLGYRLIPPERIDAFAREAMMGTAST